MKQRIIGCFLFLCIFSVLPALAANQVTDIDIEAVLYEDGSMYVTQVWDGVFDEGTEVYIPMQLPDGITLSDFQVSDENGSYRTLKTWDVDADFEEKSNKCGINETDSGFELCFGITQYGQRRYAIEYRLNQAVGAYEDWDGVNIRFVNDQMNTTPTDVNLLLRLADGRPIDDSNCDIWAFGYDGKVFFEDGGIRAYTNSPLSYEEHVTILFAFSKGILTPLRVENGSFEAVKERAFSGSDYEHNDSNDEESDRFAFLIIALLLVVFLLPILILSLIARAKKKANLQQMAEFSKRFGYYREPPNDGHPTATYALGRFFDLCQDGSILAMGILRLVDLGCLSPLREESVGFFGRTHETVSLRLHHGPGEDGGEFDEYLFTVLEGAAGSDGILQEKELAKYSERYDHLLRGYLDKCDRKGRSYLTQKGALTNWQPPAQFSHLNPAGQQELGELLGFKRYLEDFSLVAERGIQELPIWKELLSYAMLFGIADRLSEQMKELYPNLSLDIEQYTYNTTMAYSCSHLMYGHMRQAELAAEAARSGGSGGSASFGGGGGSIGGGSGGGTR